MFRSALACGLVEKANIYTIFLSSAGMDKNEGLLSLMIDDENFS